MSSKPHVVIAGAGICGLTTAIALLQRGYPVEIYEQAAELKGVGAGVQIASNGSRVLRGLGLEEAIDAVAVRPLARRVRLWNTGQSWDRPLKTDYPYWLIHRGDLHQVLMGAVRALKPDAIRLSSPVAGYGHAGSRAVLELADGRRIEADALIAADGVHSPLRRRMTGPDTEARFTGMAAWRALIPMERLPAELHEPVGINWQGPGAHIVTYPVHRGRLFNFVGVVEDQDWTEESWTSRGTVEDCLKDYAGWHPAIIAAIENMDVPYKWALLSRPPLPRWTDGPVCLVGDAAHPTLPFLAQGANMAIEDALMVARCLDAHGDPAQAFARFEALRLARTSAIVKVADDNTQRYHNEVLADPATAVPYLDAQWKSGAAHGHYDWVYDYDARTEAV
jgi:salicylate hydroxylase